MAEQEKKDKAIKTITCFKERNSTNRRSSNTLIDSIYNIFCTHVQHSGPQISTDTNNYGADRMSLLQAKNRLRIVIFKILHSFRSLCLYHSFLLSDFDHFGWGSELHAASKKQSPGKQTSRGNKTLFIFLFVHPKRT